MLMGASVSSLLSTRAVLIAAKCNVNVRRGYRTCLRVYVLIAAKCNVNSIKMCF